MKASDLDLRELLEFALEGGVIRFGGERALLLDATAMGLLRQQLIQALGLTAARGILTRLGYAHGWRTAEALKQTSPWDDAGECLDKNGGHRGNTAVQLGIGTATLYRKLKQWGKA